MVRAFDTVRSAPQCRISAEPVEPMPVDCLSHGHIPLDSQLLSKARPPIRSDLNRSRRRGGLPLVRGLRAPRPCPCGRGRRRFRDRRCKHPVTRSRACHPVCEKKKRLSAENPRFNNIGPRHACTHHRHQPAPCTHDQRGSGFGKRHRTQPSSPR